MRQAVKKATVFAAVFAGRSWAQTWRNQINVSMCTWGELRVATIRDTLYLDGGSLWWEQGFDDGSVSVENNDNFQGLLYSLNLSSTFNTATSNLTALFSSIEKAAGGVANNIAPDYDDGVMFANDDELFLYGGVLLPFSGGNPPSDSILAYERYQYGPYISLWEPGFINTPLNSVTRYVTNGAGVSSPSENLGFYVSGMRAPDWGPIYSNQSATSLSNQMITVDMSQMRNSTWSNESLPSYIPGRANAEAIWIPVSESGVLVLVGGVIYPEAIFTSSISASQQNASERVSPTFMETVSVYEVASGEWYLQNTTGDIPPQLTQFCSVYASASDGSSHNIYIYGGYSGLDALDVPSDDVYVLSLPSFEWIHLYSGENRAHGRKAHKCVKPYPDRMLVLGGVGVGDTNCIDIIQVFNLNSGRFQDTYDPADWSEYQVPELVSGRIGGNSTGSATRTSPDSWTNSSLADVFATRYTKTIHTYYPYNASFPSRSPTPTTPSIVTEEKASGFPAWAGALIGVLVGLLAIAAGIMFWLVRRRKKAKASPHTNPSPSEAFPVMQWEQYGVSPTDTGKEHENETTVSTGYTNDTAVEESLAPSVLTRTTAEAGSEQIFEMHGHSTKPPVELPTSYNDNPLPSPTSTSTLSAGQPAYVSPVSPELPGDEFDGSVSPRPPHQRKISSPSSLRSLAMRSERIPEDEEVRSQRPRYVSGVSEASVSSAGGECTQS